MSIFDVSIIGVGRMGGALALALSSNGYKVSQLVTKNYDSAKKIADLINPHPEILNLSQIEDLSTDIIFIATQDSEIEAVGQLLAKDLVQMPFIFHTSGAKPSSILHELRRMEYEVASFHPLVSISDPILGAESFQNAYFCLEGDSEALEIGRLIVSALGGQDFTIPTEFKSLYHSSAVMASGHLLTLFSLAIEMLSKCGLAQSEAQKILLPLLKSTTNNLSTLTPSSALTGTFARGDVETLQEHLQAISQNMSPNILEIYRKIGLESLKLSHQQGIDANNLQQMRDLVNGNTH